MFDNYIVDCFYDFQRIAEKFPEIPLSTVLAAETKFVEADVNRDGVSAGFPHFIHCMW